MRNRSPELRLVEPPKPEPEYDLMVHVLRDPESKRPLKYNLLEDTELFFPFKKIEKGEDIYKCMRDKNVLNSCLLLQDALAIQEKGVRVFRKVFKESHVFIFDPSNGQFSVHFLFGTGGFCGNDAEVKIAEFPLSRNFLSPTYAFLRFKS